jgi:hypothetical protein
LAEELGIIIGSFFIINKILKTYMITNAKLVVMRNLGYLGLGLFNEAV